MAEEKCPLCGTVLEISSESIEDPGDLAEGVLTTATCPNPECDVGTAWTEAA